MKKNSILKVVLLTILCVTLCTWIFTQISYSGQFAEADRNQVGIFDLSSYLLDLFRYFPYILITTLTIGAFYGVAYRIPAYRALLDKIVLSFKGKEKVFLVATIVLISAIVSVTGLSFGMLFVFPFVISVILLMGYNKLVAASCTVGSVMIGLMGTTVGSASVTYVNYILGTKSTDEMVAKIILLVVGVALLVYNVVSYANKTKNNTDKVSEHVPVIEDKKENVTVKKTKFSFMKLFAKFSKKDKKPAKKEVKKVEEKKSAKNVEKKASVKKTSTATKKTSTTKTATKKKAPAKKSTSKKTRANDNKNSNVKVVKNTNKVSVWPFVVMFDLALVLMALGTFDWAGLFNAKWPTDVLKAIRDFEIGGFPILSKILGDANNLNAFGSWGLTVEIPATIFVITIITAFIYGVKFDEFIEGVVDGMKKAVMPAVVMFLTYLVLIIVTYHPFQLHIARFFLEMTKGLNVITMTIVAMFASLFNVDSIYVAQSTLPYATSVVNDAALNPVMAVIFQAVYGVTMLVAPTSAILVGTLAYLDIPYTQWIKHIWKLVVELLVVLIVIFFILTLV